jgi:CheY-like chemotaxis protein
MANREGNWLLVVDDDDGIQDALTDLLVFEGYRVKSARNGIEALELLRDAPTLPVVILLDLMMPVMDGFEFRTVQLSDPTLACIPVLILTAGLITERVHVLRAAGCLKKPLDADRLLEELQVHAATP